MFIMVHVAHAVHVCIFALVLSLFLLSFSDGVQGPHARIHRWKDISAGDMKIWIAHLIAMGIVRKSTIEKFWEQSGLVRTPFFGTYSRRNTFQLILSNLHLNDDARNPAYRRRGHDPLHKVRPMIEMCNRNFRLVYAPQCDLSFDEGCCPFRGRLRFRCYNPKKPAKFHIKLYQVSEANSGYVLGLDVYTGKGSTGCERHAPVMDPECTVTTRVVLGLLHDVDLLNRNHHIYMDNYYTSPELFEELFARNTYACGTVRKNRKGLPKAVTEATLTKESGECVWRRNSESGLLCMKWCDKRNVTMLSTIQDALMVDTGKVDRRTNAKIEKPLCVYEYIQKMGGVDLSDQMMTYYSFLRKSMKWSRKLTIHLINMIIMNSYVLNKKFGTKKLTHEEYRDELVRYLIQTGMTRFNIPLPTLSSRRISRREEMHHHEQRLKERHFPVNIPCAEGRKRKKPSRLCFACNKLPADTGVTFAKKNTSYWCPDCEKPLCITPCFKIYHTERDYKEACLNARLQLLATEPM